jgi:RNA polymerase sigma-70 factor (ECF subfamily)
MKATLTPQTQHDALHASSLTDEELLQTYQQTGDEKLFAELVHRYEHDLFGYLRRYLGDAEMAEDAFQATFLQIHLKCDQYEPGRRVRPYLYAVATNQAIDAQRRNRRHRMVSLDRGAVMDGEEVGKLADLLVSAEPNPAARVTTEDCKGWLNQALRTLPDALQWTLQLVFFQGMKYREAAEILEVPVGTVKSRVNAAVAKLTELWNQSSSDQP